MIKREEGWREDVPEATVARFLVVLADVGLVVEDGSGAEVGGGADGALEGREGGREGGKG